MIQSNDLPSIETAYCTSTTTTAGDFGTPAYCLAPATSWLNAPPNSSSFSPNPMPTTASVRRYVQVFICDPNENVPLETCLLYKGEPKLTDLTDQELFFEIDIKSVLEKHNEKRVGYVDKSVKERTDHLDPARIRDLKMTVVTIAGF